MFGRVRGTLARGINGLTRVLSGLRGLPEKTSQNEQRLLIDEYRAKRKLGASYFTRRLNQNTRVARIASLTEAEYRAAQARGWIR